MRIKKKYLSESDEQISLFNWSKFHPVCSKYMFHIPNGGSRNLIEGRNLKLQGVKRGVSDIFLAYPSNNYHGLWIELKRKGFSCITKEQESWINEMNSLGYFATVCYGCDDAINVITQYLK